MLYSRSSGLIHSVTESLYPFTNVYLFSHPLAPGNYFSALCFCKFDFLKKGSWDLPRGPMFITYPSNAGDSCSIPG